jgi:hypothetical protein
MSTRVYIAMGALAIIASGVMSAFLAKQPSTFAMWASAYLVLVVGVTQVFLGLVHAKLASSSSAWQAYWVFGLFNVGNALVIAGTAAKYAGLGWNMSITAIGSVLLVAALVLFGWQIRRAEVSRLKIGTYVVIIGLALSTPVGLLLAHQ